MNICCQYDCPHNKSGNCQITMCDRIITFSSTTNITETDIYKNIDKQNKEIDRLNNIINELKNGIKKLDDMFYEKCRIRDEDGYYSMNDTDLQDFYDILDKIKELENDL